MNFFDLTIPLSLPRTDWVLSLVEDLERHATTCVAGCLSQTVSGGALISWVDEAWKGRVIDSIATDERAIALGAVCPDPDACRNHVEQIAPFDVKLYEKHSRNFDELVRQAGEDFPRRFAIYQEHQRAYGEGTVARHGCHYRPVMPDRFNMSMNT